MNWRRGLLMAGIHLAVAVPLILSLEASDARMLQIREEANAEATRESAVSPSQSAQPNSDQQGSLAGETVAFDLDPCSMTTRYPAQALVEQSATFPTLFFTGWRVYCAPDWSMAGRMNAGRWRGPTISDEAAANSAKRQADLAFVLVVAFQWFLVGSFPLIRLKAWWREPGAFITACTVIGGILALVKLTGNFASLLPVIVYFAWLSWFGLVAWKLLRSGWRLIARKAVAHTA